VSSGTEAAMSALRLARAATKRNVFVQPDGCYHGHADPFLIRAGSGLATLGTPDSPGVPESTASDVRVGTFNDLASIQAHFDREGDSIAAVIVEPVVGNHGVIPPAADFLPGLRALCDRHGSILIFDEVMCGFRAARGGVARVASMAAVRTADKGRYARFFHGMLERGIYLPPSAFESAFLSDAHTDDDIDRTLEAADEAMEALT